MSAEWDHSRRQTTEKGTKNIVVVLKYFVMSV